jgi:hypothetical protein
MATASDEAAAPHVAVVVVSAEKGTHDFKIYILVAFHGEWAGHRSRCVQAGALGEQPSGQHGRTRTDGSTRATCTVVRIVLHQHFWHMVTTYSVARELLRTAQFAG